MSFSRELNSWGGVPSNNLSTTSVASSAFTSSGTSLTVSQSTAQTSGLYQIPEFLTLGSMAGDKTPLTMQRGGFSGENPNKQPPKLHCNQAQTSSKYYCGSNVTQLSY